MSNNKPDDLDRGINDRRLEEDLPPNVIFQVHKRAHEAAPKGWRAKSVAAKAGTKLEVPGDTVQYVDVEVEYEEVTYKTHPKTYMEHYTSTAKELQRPNDTRRPVISNKIPEIDKHIERLTEKAKDELGKMARSQEIGIDEDQTEKLTKIADQLSEATAMRAKEQKRLDKEEITKTLNAAASVQQLGQGKGEIKDDKAQKELQDKWRVIVNWHMKKIRTNNNPINQRGLAHAIGMLNQFGGEAPDASALLEEARISYQQQRMRYMEDIKKSESESDIARLIKNRGLD